MENNKYIDIVMIENMRIIGLAYIGLNKNKEISRLINYSIYNIYQENKSNINLINGMFGYQFCAENKNSNSEFYYMIGVKKDDKLKKMDKMKEITIFSGLYAKFQLVSRIEMIPNDRDSYIESLYIIFNVIPIAFLILLAYKKKVTKLYLSYISVMYLIFAVVQNIAYLEDYGLSIVAPNIIICVIMRIVWFFEAKKCSIEYAFRHKNPFLSLHFGIHL